MTNYKAYVVYEDGSFEYFPLGYQTLANATEDAEFVANMLAKARGTKVREVTVLMD